MKTVNVAKDFTRYPSGRYKRNGSTSGEAFRERFLVDPITRGERLIVELDGTVGYGSSFLEEAFGGLVRQLGIDSATILSLIEIKASDPSLIEEVRQYIMEAGK